MQNKKEARAARQCPGMPDSLRPHAIIRSLLDIQVEDVIHNSLKKLSMYKPESPEEVMQCPERIVIFSPEMQALLQPHRAFLFNQVYRHTSVDDANNEAVRMMKKLFLYYVDHPWDMGQKAQSRIEQEGLWRTACNYVSGMTDRYAIEEYMRFELDG